MLNQISFFQTFQTKSCRHDVLLYVYSETSPELQCLNAEAHRSRIVLFDFSGSFLPVRERRHYRKGKQKQRCLHRTPCGYT